jgi:hypothetical protein
MNAASAPYPAGPQCLFCGKPERVDIFDIWSSHEFMLEACCEGLHETVVREMADDPAWARALLKGLGVEDFTGHRLRRLADDGCCGMLLDWQLELRDISFGLARRFIDRHHAHCAAPLTWRFGQACWNGATMIGVVSVGNPVARALCSQGALEVNRLCIRRDIPRALAWNAASMLYGWSAREAERRGWSRIVTYTRADEDGGSLIAAGWTPEATVRGRGWLSGQRARANRNAFIDKTRWGKALRPRTRVVMDPRPQRAPAAGRHSLANPWSNDSGLSIDPLFALS